MLSPRYAALSGVFFFLAVGASAQTMDDRAATAAASAAERAREMTVLGIAELQPPSTAYDIGKPGNANYDEAKANPYPGLPALLVFRDGTPVRTAAQWQKRRAELKALFDETVYGKYPAHIPAVTWKMTGAEQMTVQGIPALVKHVTGHVDNSAYPAITVDIQLDVVTPQATHGHKVPVIIGGGSIRPRPVFTPAPGQAIHKLKSPDSPPDSAKLLLEKGWGFVWINTTDVQADNGASLTKGIIGLVNKGQPRAMDDWGVMGHSRGGKAALVAMVDDPRFAIGFISSSGAGGANLYRRNYGEPIGNLTSNNEFHWFAGNFLRYAAKGHTPDEMPVDSHEFIALVAPRPLFIGGGALITDPDYAPGDAWQDTQGMFMAAAAASPAWELLGKKGLGASTLPPMGVLLDKGEIGFRQHEYGHTPAPNWPAFIAFASRFLK